jgi:phage tail-like protein
MAEFVVNPHRLDPYKVFKFQVILDGNIVPGVSRVSALRRHTEPVQYRSGAFANFFLRAPGTTKFDPIVLERGVTHDTVFEDWAELAYSPAGDAAMSLRNFRKDMRINLLNQQGTVVLSYMVYRCWVSEYQPLPELNADANAVAMETIVLEHEGFERDRGVSEPEER